MPSSNVVAMGDGPQDDVEVGRATKIIVLLIGIAALLLNIVGLWRATRVEREASIKAAFQ